MSTSMEGKLEGKRVLVTGASGFIGAHLCDRLCQVGAEVHAVYQTHRPEESGEKHWWQADLASFADVRRIISETQPDILYHLASYVKGAPDLEHVLPTFQSNLQSTVNLLTLASEYKCSRVVLTGSLAEPDVENGELFPPAPYAAAKWASSGYARMFHALYKLPTVIARVFMVYGPAQRDLTKLIPYVSLSLLQGKIPKITSGARLLDWIYVSDVVDGFMVLGQAANIEGSTVELGSGSLISIREIVQKVAEIVGPDARVDFGALPDRPLEPLRTAKTAESEEKIGWKPKVSLDEGLPRTVDWYRAQLRDSAHTYASI